MHDIMIIGAGLAGSAAAATLAGLGWDVLLVERDQFPRHKVCGEFLSPESQASLYAMGLYDAVAALKPVALHQARFVSQHGVALQIKLPAAAWGLSRFALDAALAAGAVSAGADLRSGVTAVALRREADGYALDLRDGSQTVTAHARAALLACGRHALPGLRAGKGAASALAGRDTPASQFLFSSPHTSSVGVKSHYEGVHMPAQVEIYLFDGGYAGINPVEGGRANLCMLVTRETFQRAGASIEGLLGAVRGWNPALGQRLAGAHPLAETACAVAAVDTGRAAAPRGLAAQLGDAAAMIPPLCGDGMAMALGAAEICTPLAHEALAGRMTLAAWEERYQAAWHAEFDPRLRTGRSIQTVLSTPLLADMLLAAGKLLPWAAEHLARATRGQVRDLAGLRPITQLPR